MAHQLTSRALHLFCKKLYLFIFGCARSSLPLRLFSSCSLVAVCGLLICSGFSCGAWALEWVGFSSCGSWAPEHKLNSCGARSWLPLGMLDLPGPKIEPVSPELAGGFSTTEPLGKPYSIVLLAIIAMLYIRFPQDLLIW